ncbi:CDGSH iron-sulfur domain-containing protein [Natronomonas gomsonensis]|uniref:CDGSH iron-sulfur domain-containing protein n=1 Tax=Natronomonas gomsonensis TaxID=1046043 RepID=UPI0015BE22D7|nr:CDGSH iron-sulfur domain-containing protein [Natronomonas gomsonensis]
MAREVRHEATTPAVFDESDLAEDGKLFLCQCGLSSERPLCDGSHRATEDEDEDVVYRYDADGEGRRIVEALELSEE